MLDIKRIRSNPEEVQAALDKRHGGFSISGIIELDAQKRALLAEVEALKARRNEGSALVPRLKKEGKGVEADTLMAEMKSVSEKIAALDEKVRAAEEEAEYLLLTIPNTPHESVPVGASDADNVEVRHWGEPRKFDFEPKAHWDIGDALGTLDFIAAGKVTGARFAFHRGMGARLERAIINFFMDTHSEHGYIEVLPPYIVHRRSMVGTGQLPKFEEDAFKLAGTDYFLIPTAEVPVTNMHRESVLEGDMLPLCYCAYSACFRSEAGSAGRDTRGLIRNHQFDKVELVKFTTPEESYAEHEKLTRDAERVLQLLKLPYRVMALSTGDMGFTSAKTYDLEVWMPSYNRYVEISSCSNFEDYQARRADIKYRPAKGEKPRFVHTLNGSGVAVGRTMAAILENYQNADGSVNIPEVLVPYVGSEVMK